jgi:very-short-patch-repair endonuclease
LESFFIKNLENVQGDERDVIFIGTVYGPEKEGAPVMQRFGPINGVAGKKRLNVLFSRAKERIDTFSSMNASDIKAEEETGNAGVYMLKKWLEYSATKEIESGKVVNTSTDSEFEDHVIQQLKSIGCDAIPQVGVKGYSIDIGVKHPNWPHGFIMGVECDGASYHSSKSARDRDRLRQNVLEGLGWNLYRIWSTDWFNDPVRETEKLREAIEKRMIELKK